MEVQLDSIQPVNPADIIEVVLWIERSSTDMRLLLLEILYSIIVARFFLKVIALVNGAKVPYFQETLVAAQIRSLDGWIFAQGSECYESTSLTNVMVVTCVTSDL